MKVNHRTPVVETRKRAGASTRDTTARKEHERLRAANVAAVARAAALTIELEAARAEITRLKKAATAPTRCAKADCGAVQV